ncbi:GlxA family transcriptional regulator [Streptomyces sp. NPDC001941]|uniref:GlxA family transcriptional regulator n=1 Tax=Streptomyces sp. NPDC001941 TaxID=3154659 RepID=UPI00331ED30B
MAERHGVVVLAFDRVQLLDVGGPVEVFTTANAFGARYDVRIASPGGGDVVTSAGVRLGVDGGPEILAGRPGTLVVPGREDWQRAVGDRALVSLVREAAPRARRVASVCAGAFVLAEAGVLDGRRAATHWRLAGELATAYPRVRVEADPVFVGDGRVFSSAGVTAGIDLSLALVEADHGADLAREVARQLVVFMARPGGQSQFSARLGPQGVVHPVVRRVMDLVGADPAAEHALDDLAAAAGVSARHLGRLFRTEAGTTPAQYVETVRLEAAQALLEAGPAPVERVAREAGFGSSETMRRVFKERLGISPTVYRARFRSTAGEEAPDGP